MNKKRILSLVLSVLIVFPVTAYAKGNNDDKGKSNDLTQIIQNVINKDKHSSDNEGKDNEQENEQGDKAVANTSTDAKSKDEEHKQEAMQNKDAKKQQIAQFKTQMKAKHDQMAAIRVQSKAVRQQIEEKREQLVAIIEDLQSGKKTLPADMLNQLLAAAQNLKVDARQVKAAAEINNEVSDAQAKVKGRDFNNALASMDKVIARLQQRLDALKQLNSDLDSALAIANKAVAPAPSTTTDQTSTGTQTTTTDPSSSQTSTTTTDTNGTQISTTGSSAAQSTTSDSTAAQTTTTATN